MMDTIDISQNIQDFKQVFENESIIIFSANFGDGKSYFLKEFMKSYDKNLKSATIIQYTIKGRFMSR